MNKIMRLLFVLGMFLVCGTSRTVHGASTGLSAQFLEQCKNTIKGFIVTKKTPFEIAVHIGNLCLIDLGGARFEEFKPFADPYYKVVTAILITSYLGDLLNKKNPLRDLIAAAGDLAWIPGARECAKKHESSYVLEVLDELESSSTSLTESVGDAADADEMPPPRKKRRGSSYAGRCDHGGGEAAAGLLMLCGQGEK